MKINNAVKKISKSKDNLWMYRKKYDIFAERFYIKPTNSGNCCLVLGINIKTNKIIRKVGNRWNPNLEDLMANDWKLENLSIPMYEILPELLTTWEENSNEN